MINAVELGVIFADPESHKEGNPQCQNHVVRRNIMDSEPGHTVGQ